MVPLEVGEQQFLAQSSRQVSGMENTTPYKEITMTEGTDIVVSICPRCGGAIEVGQNVYVVGENEVMATGELHLIRDVEKICEDCYPHLERTWPDRVEHEQGDGKKALAIIVDEKTLATG